MEEERTYINLYAPHLVNTKTYVCVRAYFNTEGVILPDVIIWEDGRRFKIDRVTQSRPAASLKGGGSGIRYTCMIRGNETYLYLDGNRWFVERKNR